MSVTGTGSSHGTSKAAEEVGRVLGVPVVGEHQDHRSGGPGVEAQGRLAQQPLAQGERFVGRGRVPGRPTPPRTT